MSEDEYAPTTAIMRLLYANDQYNTDARAAEFDRWLADHDAEVTEALRAEVARLNHQADVDLMALNSAVDAMASADADRKVAEAKIAAVEVVHHPVEYPTSASSIPGYVPATRTGCSCALGQAWQPCAVRAALTDEPRP